MKFKYFVVSFTHSLLKQFLQNIRHDVTLGLSADSKNALVQQLLLHNNNSDHDISLIPSSHNSDSERNSQADVVFTLELNFRTASLLMFTMFHDSSNWDVKERMMDALIYQEPPLLNAVHPESGLHGLFHFFKSGAPPHFFTFLLKRLLISEKQNFSLLRRFLTELRDDVALAPEIINNIPAYLIELDLAEINAELKFQSVLENTELLTSYNILRELHLDPTPYTIGRVELLCAAFEKFRQVYKNWILEPSAFSPEQFEPLRDRLHERTYVVVLFFNEVFLRLHRDFVLLTNQAAVLLIECKLSDIKMSLTTPFLSDGSLCGITRRGWISFTTLNIPKFKVDLVKAIKDLEFKVL